MTRTVFEHHTLLNCVREVYAKRAGEPALVLCSSMDEADLLKKALAQDPCFLTRGLNITHFASYLADQWELKGDGRFLVSSLERLCMVYKLLQDCDLGFAVSVGCAKELASFVSECPLLSNGFESLLEERELSPSELKLSQFALLYKKQLDAKKLIEPAEAARLLACAETRPCVFRVSATPAAHQRAFIEHYPDSLDFALVGSGVANTQLNELGLWVELLEKAGIAFERAETPAPSTEVAASPALQALQMRLFAPDETNPLTPNGEIEIDLPAGRYAQASLMAERLRVSLESGKSCTLCTNEPSKAFFELQQFLPDIKFEFTESKFFSETASGQVFLNLLYVLGESAPANAPCLVADVLLSDVSHLSQRQAFKRAAQILPDRLMTTERALGLLSVSSGKSPQSQEDRELESLSLIERLIALIQKKDLFGALDELLAYYEPRQFNPETGIFASMEVRAIKSAQNMVEIAKRHRLSTAAIIDFLSAIEVFMRVRTTPDYDVSDQELTKAQGMSAVVAQSDPEKQFAQAAFKLILDEDPNAVRFQEVLIDSPHFTETEKPQLRIETLSAFAKANEPTQVLMVTDLNSSDLSLAKKPFIHQGLFGIHDCALVQDKTLVARSHFMRALELTEEKLHLVRIMNNTDADPENPSVLFDDVIDCYRSNLRSDKELVRSSQLPPCLHEESYQRGEDELAANLSPHESALSVDPKIQFPDTLDAQELALVQHKPYDGKVFEKPLRFSASSIEAYLSCPASWFYSRHLKSSDLGEDFGPQEKGSFAHAVLQQFFEQAPKLIEDARVTPDNVELAKQVLREIAVQEERRQFDLCPGDRLVPINPLEAEEVIDLIEGLTRFIDSQQRFASSFKPAYLEWGFGYENEVHYAGLPLCGRIDRIDVDDQGNALIIDYKSQKSFKAEDYSCTPAELASFKLPLKIQTLIYAQIVRRELGLKVRGALYLSVAKDAGAGLIDDRFIGAPDLGGHKSLINASEKRFESFEEALDLVEAKIEERMQALVVQGFVGAVPADASSCTYCLLKSTCDEERTTSGF